MASGRVGITGIGIVACLGNDPAACFEALVHARSGIRRLPNSLAGCSGIGVGGMVENFDDSGINKVDARRTARFIQFALVAARSARQDAGLAEARYAPDRVGTILGSSLAGMDVATQAVDTFIARGPRRLSPSALVGSIASMAPGMVAIDASAKGPCLAMSSAWTSSAHALGRAFELIRDGSADAMIVGGSEAVMDARVLALLGATGFFSSSLGSVPETVSRPFDRRHDGLVPSEGAAVVVLESVEAAERRGARVRAEIRGHGASHGSRGSEFRDASMAQAMRRALEVAKIDCRDVTYVNASGSAYPSTDVLETSALKLLFGAHVRSLWIGGTKGSVGHMLGAAGAFDVATTAMALERGVVPPIGNLEEPAERCDLDYVRGVARRKWHSVALSNTFCENGGSVALVLARHGSNLQ